MGKKGYERSLTSVDGNILTVVNTDLGDANTSYTYFDLSWEAYKHFTLNFTITATTLTLEACNVDTTTPTTISVVASATDGAGATFTASTLNSAQGFIANDDLNGLPLIVTADTTTAANVGLIRTITDYAGATGACTLSTALGAITDAVTTVRLYDSTNLWGRKVSDPSGARWRDVTLALTGAATATASGAWIIDTPVNYSRLRIKRVTTNANNALILDLCRGR